MEEVGGGAGVDARLGADLDDAAVWVGERPGGIAVGRVGEAEPPDRPFRFSEVEAGDGGAM